MYSSFDLILRNREDAGASFYGSYTIPFLTPNLQYSDGKDIKATETPGEVAHLQIYSRQKNVGHVL